MADPSDFIKLYEKALGSQDWQCVAPLIMDDACVIFSNGALHKGKDAIRAAYEHNFKVIVNEEYRIENVHWLIRTPTTAAYMFDFFWTGLIDGSEVSGSGRGTAVLKWSGDRWHLLAEQLGPKADAS